jgi:amidase
MNRRGFIKTSSMVGIAYPIFTVIACDTRKRDLESKEVSPSFELHEITLAKLQERMGNGTLTARQITQLYLDRIKAIDLAGPKLNSVIEINPDALKIADQLDAERKDGKVRGPLHGIPVLIKDNINTADKMKTSAGSLALASNVAAEDAFIVSKLRNAGAIILGKTNLSEWANFRSTRSSSGWSSRGGQTRNPYILDRNPCGSSSGSGVAVSANLCAISIGTETNGSIACPSSINGIVGIKPTVGLWSRSGIIPISHTQDTAGPMARTVTDASVLLGILSGIDPNDPATRSSEGKGHADYTKFLDGQALKGKRIGIEKKYLQQHEAVDALLQNAIDQLKQGGAEVITVELQSKIKIEGAEYELLQQEFKAGLNKYLSTSSASVKSLKDLIAFNKENESRVMPFFKQEILESSEQKAGLESSDYKEALQKVLSVRATIDAVLKEHQLDAICGPANGPSWCTDLINGDFFTGYGMYSPAAMAGYPHVTIPLGFVFDLPVGLTFLGTAYSEGPLLGIAYAYEQLSKNRVAPDFKTNG